PRQNLRLGRKRHPIRPSSPRRRLGPWANRRPRRRWLKTIIVRRRRRPPRASRRRSHRDHPKARPARLCKPDEPAAQIPPASKATRVLDPDEITLLMKQGEQFIAAGDVVTARIVFQRAAEAGDADAALALGATYDPIVLANLGVAGLGANVEKARIWY